MLAVQNRRPDLVKELLLQGADVDIVDYQGRSPLSMATAIGGDLAIEIMGSLLAAKPSKDDGSLHNAARELNLPAVKVLIEAGHDPDFPSPCHGGRSALGEVCLKGTESEELTAEREKAMQKVVTYLVDKKSDLSIKSEGKSMLHICFDARDPVGASRIFLKAGMWKHINSSFNDYTKNDLVYSPTMYVRKVLRNSDSKEHLLDLLYANRAIDVFYAIEGAQPEDAIGMPEEIKARERVRKARLEQMDQDKEDFAASLARMKELASVESSIWAQKAEMEDKRRRKLQDEDLLAIRNRAHLEESLEKASHQRRISEHRALTDASTARISAIAAAELEAQDKSSRKMLEWETRANRERVDNARALTTIRMSEREENDRLDRNAEDRRAKNLEAQRKVIESQDRLARRIAEGPGNADQRRQIGYVSEELN